MMLNDLIQEAEKDLEQIRSQVTDTIAELEAKRFECSLLEVSIEAMELVLERKERILEDQNKVLVPERISR